MQSKLRPIVIPLLITFLLFIVLDQILGIIYKWEIIGSSQDVGNRIHTMETDSKDYPVLMFGESVFQQVDQLYAKNEDERALPLSTRFVTTIIGDYFLFRRYLLTHKAPEVVVIGMNSGVAGLDFNPNLNPGVDGAILRTFTEFYEMAELQGILKDRGLLWKQVAYKYFNFMYLFPIFKMWADDFMKKPEPPAPAQPAPAAPALEQRAQPVPKVDWATSGLSKFWKMDQLKDKPHDAYKIMKSHGNGCSGGALFFNIANEKRHEEEAIKALAKVQQLKIDYPLMNVNPYMINFCVMKDAHTYFQKFIELAAEHGTRVVFTPTPLAESKYKMLTYTGIGMLVDYYFSFLETKYDSFFYVHDHFRSYPDTAFTEGLIHFSPEGIQYYRELKPLTERKHKSNLNLQDVFTIGFSH